MRRMQVGRHVQGLALFGRVWIQLGSLQDQVAYSSPRKSGDVRFSRALSPTVAHSCHGRNLAQPASSNTSVRAMTRHNRPQ